MSIEIISVEEAIKRGHYTWKKGKNDIQYFGHINGLCEGFCVEVKKNGVIGYMSMDASGAVLKNDNSDFTDFYNSWMLECNCEPTGVVVFRGYFTEEYDIKEHDWFIEDASYLVEKMFS